MPTATQYQEYLRLLADPDKIVKIAKLEFLNFDGTVAFVVDNNYKRFYGGGNESRAFLQDGVLNVSLQNGQRRKANIVLENLDGAFDFAVNKLWFGQKIRLQEGVQLKDGTDFYLPQGVFYIDAPTLNWKPNSRQAEYSLTDKWSYLDGSVFGRLRNTYEIPAGENLFLAAQKILQYSRFSLKPTLNPVEMIDNVTPTFTDYYNSRITVNSSGQVRFNNQTPNEIRIEFGKTFADILLELNSLIAGWIGYDNTGTLNILPSENDIADQTKPIMWDYSTASKTFLGLTETSNIGDVYNEVTIIGESIDSDTSPVGRAINNDPNSDTSVGNIGLHSREPERASGYYTQQQCEALAAFRLKRSTVLQKSVTITSTQMFHLQENSLVTVQRTDKQGAPTERHLIQSFSLPIAQNRAMTITATSVTDYPQVTIEPPNVYGEPVTPTPPEPEPDTPTDEEVQA